VSERRFCGGHHRRKQVPPQFFGSIARPELDNTFLQPSSVGISRRELLTCTTALDISYRASLGLVGGAASGYRGHLTFDRFNPRPQGLSLLQQAESPFRALISMAS